MLQKKNRIAATWFPGVVLVCLSLIVFSGCGNHFEEESEQASAAEVSSTQPVPGGMAVMLFLVILMC